MDFDASNLRARELDTLHLSEGVPVITAANIIVGTALPVRELPFLSLICIRCKSADDTGLPDRAECPTLDRVIDSVCATLDWRTALLVGRVTTKGTRSFYFYVQDADNFVREAKEKLRAWPDYETQVQAHSDAAWKFYAESIAPLPAYKAQQGRTKLVLQRLQKSGDDLTGPRDFDHALEFPSEEMRQQFVQWASAQRFDVHSNSQTEKQKAAQVFPIDLSRCEVPDWKFLNGTLYDLVINAAKYRGTYTGSGCMAQVKKA